MEKASIQSIGCKTSKCHKVTINKDNRMRHPPQNDGQEQEWHCRLSFVGKQSSAWMCETFQKSA